MTSRRLLIGLSFLTGLTLVAAAADAADCPANLRGIAALSCVVNANTAADAALAQVEAHLPRSEPRQTADAAYATYSEAQCRYEAMAFVPAAASPTEHLTLYYGCQALLTQDRATTLQHYSHARGG
jgi:hypothetical protein